MSDFSPATSDIPLSIRRPFRIVAIWAFLGALLINLFCNSFSPFFIPEGAMDPNCFYAEGCAIAHGYLPYKDFIDVKGPLLFFIYTIGYLLTPTHCLGIFFIYVLATWGTIIAFYRTAELFQLTPRAAILATFLTICCLFSRLTTFWAAQPEQLLALPFSWTLYYLTAFLKYPTAHFNRALGWCLGSGGMCTFLIKYNFVLPYAVIFILTAYEIARHFSKSDVLKFHAHCFMCASLVCAPFIIYLSFFHLWENFFHSYFMLNIEANAHQAALSPHNFIAWIMKLLDPASWLSYIILGHTFVYCLLKRNNPISQNIMRRLIPAFITTYVSCAMGSWGYYYIMIAPLAIYLCVDLSSHDSVVAFTRHHVIIKSTIFALLFIFVINAYCISSLAWGRSAENTEQINTIQDIVAKVKTPKIIYYDCADILLGRRAKSLPGTPAWMNLPYVGSKTYEQRDRDISEKKVDFIVTAGQLKENVQLLLRNAGYEPILGAKIETISFMKNVQLWSLSQTRVHSTDTSSSNGQ